MTPEEMAYKKYNGNFDNRLYNDATRNHTIEYCNELIDAALHLCGHPFYQSNDRNWHPKAKKFLARFQ